MTHQSCCTPTLVQSSLWAASAEQLTLYTQDHASQEGINCTKAKEYLKSCCLIYKLCMKRNAQWLAISHPSALSPGYFFVLRSAH